ncbi:MAG: hypothetical protein NDJ94_07630 [Vicinamibacteria bacterium]|jgi:hypothetical protein|nr:hypothetical protein [Vicinamibacteria bacterium]
MTYSSFRRPSAALVLLLLTACGGGGSSSPSAPSNPITNTTPTPTPAPTATATPTPVPGGGATASCALGYGVWDAPCSRNAGQFLTDVMAAIDQLQKEKPTLFDTTQVAGGNAEQWRVTDAAGYYEGVLGILRRNGFCASLSGTMIQVKNSNSFSEDFDILLSSGHVRRGDAAYRNTCQPASFPIDPTEMIARVRVGFFEIRCLDGRTPPRNGENTLPIGCLGTVTASPKDKDEHDVPASVHGPDIEWELVQDGFIADIENDPVSTFNKFVSAHNPGTFELCATVQTIRGCMRATVTQ